MSSRVLVEVKVLSKTFDVSKPWLNRAISGEKRQVLVAVDRASFDIVRGETLALVGESGSGKSTLARMVVGLIEPSSGSVRIDGIDLSADQQSTAMRDLRRRIQMIFQDPYSSLNPRWRVGRIIAEPLYAFGLVGNAGEARARVDELLAQVGLDAGDATKYPHAFSGGQRQRIVVARALASNPEFIVCDEPTSALDVSVQAQILNLLRDLQDQSGITFLFISHNLAVVRHMANRVAVMYLGRIVEVAPTDDLFSQPKHPYTRMLLDAVPDLNVLGGAARVIQGEIANPIDQPKGCVFHPRCPLAFDRCRFEAPRAQEHGAHIVACHAVSAD